MSKIGKKSILVPQGVTIAIDGNCITVKGPKGEMKRGFPEGFSVAVEHHELIVKPPVKSMKDTAALWGTMRVHLANMVHGVTEGFTKTLTFEGIGFRAEASEKKLTLSVGYTHPVELLIPEEILVTVAKNTITVFGADRYSVGEFAAKIRRVKPPEPYKGTGIRYQDEVVRRKAGKKLAGAGTSAAS